MPCHKDNMRKLKELGTVLFINTSYDSITQRLKINQKSRPLIKSGLDDKNEELHSLFIKRQKIYMSSDKIVAGDRNPSFIVEEILHIL